MEPLFWVSLSTQHQIEVVVRLVAVVLWVQSCEIHFQFVFFSTSDKLVQHVVHSLITVSARVVHYPRKLRNKRKIKGAVCLSTRFWSNLHILTIKMAIFRVFDAARGVLARAPRTRSSWVNGQKSEISKIFKIFEMSILSFNQVILIVFGPKM